MKPLQKLSPQTIIRLLTIFIMLLMSQTTFYFLTLNTFLAYVPIELSFQIQRTSHPWLQKILTVFWLLFFPNIPYLASDIIHADLLTIYSPMGSVPSVRFWGLLIILFLVVFAYIIWGFTQLLALMTALQIKYRLKSWISWGILLGICFLSSMGIYAGRFSPRLHSVYFLTDPWQVVDIIFLQWSVKKLELVILFWFLHLGILFVLYIHERLRQEVVK